MSSRRATVRALAKINLSLRVLRRRPDNYHELRTIFQTISLADRIEVTFTPSRKTAIEVTGNLEIPNNLIVRAAVMILDRMRLHGQVHFRLDKRIPMGAGLGGGSSDAASVLLALPVLAGCALEFPALLRIAAELGSDVPFFLLGGTAVGIGRGAELFPLPDPPPRHGLLAAPGLHVSTAEAYRALGSRLTSESEQNKIISFQSKAWDICLPAVDVNDFEGVVFEQFPVLKSLKRRLVKLGAASAMMTGSGSALFGFFRTRDEVERAIQSLGENSFPITTVSRTRYRALWWRQLRPHIVENLWPPRSRYAQ